MSDDVALRVVDDRNRSRNWSRAPSSLGVRLQLFETRVGPSTGRPLICILTKGVRWTFHDPEPLVSPVPRVPDGPAWCASVVLGVAKKRVDVSRKTSVGTGEKQMVGGVGGKLGVCRCR